MRHRGASHGRSAENGRSHEKKTLTAYLAALRFLVVADGIWLGLLMPPWARCWACWLMAPMT